MKAVPRDGNLKMLSHVMKHWHSSSAPIWLKSTFLCKATCGAMWRTITWSHQFKCSKLYRRFVLFFFHLNRRKLALICLVGRRKRRRKRTTMRTTSTRVDLGGGEGIVICHELLSGRISRYFSPHADKIKGTHIFFLSSIFKRSNFRL